MVIYDALKAVSARGAEPGGRAATRNYLRPDKTLGIGDRTFPALVLAYDTPPSPPESSRLVRAAASGVLAMSCATGPFPSSPRFGSKSPC